MSYSCWKCVFSTLLQAQLDIFFLSKILKSINRSIF
jgi:hypothetical protein